MIAWLLKLITGAATGNPLLLLWVAGGIALAAGAAGTAAGWTLNGWRLGAQLAECESTSQKFQTANAALNLKIAEQDAAVEDLDKKGRAARAAGRQAGTVAAMMAEQQAGEIAALRVSLAAATPPGKTCTDAWDVIKAGKVP